MTAVRCPRCGVAEQLGIELRSAFFQAAQPASGSAVLLACAMCDHQFMVRLG